MKRRVALLGHAIGSSDGMWGISPINDGGIEEIMQRLGIDVQTLLLPGHASTYRDLATVRGEEWLDVTKQSMSKLFAKEYEEYCLFGFSLGGVLKLLALVELLEEGCVPVDRTRVVVVNTPVLIKGLPPKLQRMINKLPRNVTEKISIPNVPRPWEPNRAYLRKALVSKLLPLSAVMEMMKLIDQLLTRLAEPQWEAQFQQLKQLTLIQAVPDRVVDPQSVDILHERVGGKVYRIDDATHAFPEEGAWTTLCQLLEHQLIEH